MGPQEATPPLEVPCAPPLEVPGDKFWDQIFEVKVVFRLLRPKGAITHPITEKFMCLLFLTLYNWSAMKHPSLSLFQLCFWGKGRLLAQLGRRCWGAPHRILTLFNPLWPRNGARTPAIKRLQAGIFQPANQCATATVLKHIRDSHFSNCGDNSQCQMLSHYL